MISSAHMIAYRLYAGKAAGPKPLPGQDLIAPNKANSAGLSRLRLRIADWELRIRGNGPAMHRRVAPNKPNLCVFELKTPVALKNKANVRGLGWPRLRIADWGLGIPGSGPAISERNAPNKANFCVFELKTRVPEKNKANVEKGRINRAARLARTSSRRRVIPLGAVCPDRSPTSVRPAPTWPGQGPWAKGRLVVLLNSRKYVVSSIDKWGDSGHACRGHQRRRTPATRVSSGARTKWSALPARRHMKGGMVMGMDSNADGAPARRRRRTRFGRGAARWARLGSGRRWLMRCGPAVGLLSLIWFLIRVVPKPSRATYPCQRVAFPLASGFVLWVVAGLGSIAAFRRARGHLRKSHCFAGVLLLGASVGAVYVALSHTAETPLAAASSHLPNQPLGVGQGIHPGRVVWVHHPDATNWDGPGSENGHWWDNDATDQRQVERMLSAALRGLAGAASDEAAWDALFRHFNLSKGRGGEGYRTGEKVMVKLNLVATHYGLVNVDADGNQVETETFGLDLAGIAPQMALALVRQLVYRTGVEQDDLTIGDTLCRFPNRYWNPIHSEFPGVTCIDHEGVLGRVKPRKSQTQRIHWSADTAEPRSEGVPTCFAEATYVINFACLKGHAMAGVTLCAKNHYGSLCRTPIAWDASWDPDYLDLHASLADAQPGMGKYRALVDLLGCRHLGGKTMLCLIDGLYGAQEALWPPSRWSMAPFDGDWTSSLFVSQDPVAIDSVAFDFLKAEFSNGNPHLSGADDYLHEAAQADAPPSGTFYDPDHAGDVERLASLGVHEHWNNPLDRLYSRNLGLGSGIELVALAAPQVDINSDGRVGFEDIEIMAEQWLDVPAVPSADLAPALGTDGVVDLRDFAALAENWRTSLGSPAR